MTQGRQSRTRPQGAGDDLLLEMLLDLAIPEVFHAPSAHTCGQLQRERSANLSRGAFPQPEARRPANPQSVMVEIYAICICTANNF
jgi:hypothetical protein